MLLPQRAHVRCLGRSVTQGAELCRELWQNALLVQTTIPFTELVRRPVVAAQATQGAHLQQTEEAPGMRAPLAHDPDADTDRDRKRQARRKASVHLMKRFEANRLQLRKRGTQHLLQFSSLSQIRQWLRLG